MGGKARKSSPLTLLPIGLGLRNAGRQRRVRGRWMEPLPHWDMDRNDSLKVPRKPDQIDPDKHTPHIPGSFPGTSQGLLLGSSTSKQLMSPPSYTQSNLDSEGGITLPSEVA